MIRKTVVSKMEPPDPKYDGAQDHHMVLQAVDQEAHIHHVPTVLYHWRICEGSTAAGTASKPYADVAGKLAIEHHLEKQRIKARVGNTEAPCRYRVTYEPAQQPLVSIVIPNKDNAEVLAVCIDVYKRQAVSLPQHRICHITKIWQRSFVQGNYEAKRRLPRKA